MRFLKPLDTELLEHVCRTFDRIITIEDGVKEGGFGSAVIEFMAQKGYTKKISIMGLPDRFVEHGSPSELYHITNLDEEAIYNEILKLSK